MTSPVGAAGAAAFSRPASPLTNQLQLFSFDRKAFEEIVAPEEDVRIATDDFVFEPRAEIKSITSVDTGDCVTIFGISKDKKFIWARHMSTLENPDPEVQDQTILDELKEMFGEDASDEDEAEEARLERQQLGSFDLYLVGGNGSDSSNRLVAGIQRVIPKFFDENTTIVDSFLHQAPSHKKNYITANLNLNGELRYYFHNTPNC